MEVGVVRVAEDEDFDRLKKLVDNHEGWKLEYNKPSIRVWTKATDDKSSFKLIKVVTIFSDVEPSVLYDVLHDPDYRKEWDTHMLCSEDIGFLNINNDVGYYSMSCPAPLKNRDFVLQRSWLDTGLEQMILNHSVFHKNYPPRKGFVRAISQLTGFVVRAAPGGGCSLGYVSQTEPQGRLPAWLVNSVSQTLAPRMAKKLHTAALGYLDWKQSSPNPYLMPWRCPEQVPSLRITVADCIDTGQKGSRETLPDDCLMEKPKRRKSFIRRLSESE